MIFRRVLFALVAAAVLATSASVCLIALALALYALVLPAVGAAGAAAIVAGVAAAIIAAGGLAALVASRQKSKAVAAPGAVFERLLGVVKERPVTAAAAALGAAFMAIRDPKYLGHAARAFFEGGPKARRK